jgi:pimeloyl-ACP methyl ester carboxylesterase
MAACPPSQEINQENFFPSNPLPALATDLYKDDGEDVSDGEGMAVQDLSGEDVQSIMEVSISPIATHLTSVNTPATEKAIAIEEFEGSEPLYVDGGATPPTELPSTEEQNDALHPREPQELGPFNEHHKRLSLGAPPSPDPRNTGLPTPWQAGPKPLVVERPEESRSALREALTVTKRRSFSGSGEALKKFFPSMPKAPSFISSLPSLPSNVIQKSRDRALSLSRDLVPSPLTSILPFLSDASTKGRPTVPQRPYTNVATDSTTVPAPTVIRRATSDESLLYHSMSRASSLGDDTRFENHTEMINSRIKAIRDSLQDRSSFRLPSMPSLPNLPSMPSFNFSMNFAFNLNPGSNIVRSKADADSIEGIIPNNNTRKKPSVTSNLAVTPGMAGASIPRPGAAVEAARPTIEGPNTGFLDRALAKLTGDIVIMGGYRGSILRSAKPPHRQLWVPVKVGLNIRKVNLEVGLEPEDEERMEEHIFSSGMIQNIGPVDISKRLFKRLRECENAKNGSLRIWDYGYDWRLSPHLLSRKLLEFLEKLPSNKAGVPKKDRGALVIAHSLGGLITRHAVNQRPELFSGVVYAGVPNTCINILGPLRNGDAVLLSSRVLTAQVNFTLRTSFALLPLDGGCFIDINTKERYPVDFFDVEDWLRYRWSPCIDLPFAPKAQPIGALANILKTSSLTSLPLLGKKSSNPSMKDAPKARDSSPLALVNPSESQQSRPQPPTTCMADAAQGSGRTYGALAPQMENPSNPAYRGQSMNSSVSTAVTIPRDKAIAYLRRTLAETKQFKLELGAHPDHAANNRYPPLAVIYGKSVPTVFAAKVDGRDGIACADAYDNLAFASGDGVCLAKEAMLPEGYFPVSGGRISSDRGHLTLLGDLNAVGRAIESVTRGRVKGLGLGV